MRLLDAPIQKEAELSNKQAIARILVGTGLGAGAGALGEYLTTGELGWKGGVLGALLGTGTAAALRPEARKKLMSTMRAKLSGKEEDTGEVTTTEPSPEEVPNEEYFNDVRNLLQSDAEIPDDLRASLQDELSQYEQHKWEIESHKQGVATGAQLRKDPRFKGVFDITKASEGKQDLSNYVYQYAHAYKNQTGSLPSPEHLSRFATHTRAGALSPAEWYPYMQDKHPLSSQDEYPMGLAAAQGTQVIPGLQKKIVKGLEGPIERMQQTPRGRKVLEKTFGKGATNTGWRKFLFGKGGKLTTAKMAGKAVPGLNLIIDAPEFFVDPNTGEFSSDVGKNMAELERLYTIREQGLKEHAEGALLTSWLPDWKAKIGDHEFRLKDFNTGERDMFYNVYGGAWRGIVNPLTSLAVAEKRRADTSDAYLENVKNRGFVSGNISNLKSLGAAGAQSAAEYALPWLNLKPGKKIKKPKFNWGSDVKAPSKQELEALRDKIANRRGYYEVDGKRIPIQDYNKNYRR
jgi:hypothetical protein